LRDDKGIRLFLNERVGMLSGYERTLLSLVPVIEATDDREEASAEELAQDSERERHVLQRRLRLQLVRTGRQHSDDPLSVA
jgi:hypothetical protein